MSIPRLILVGAGGHAKACIDVIEQEAKFAIAGLIGLPKEVGSRILGHRVIGSDQDLDSFLKDNSYGIVCVGQIKTPESRIRLFSILVELKKLAPPIISPHAYVSRHAQIGEGSIVMHGATVNAGARVGRNCIVNSSALVEHDAVIQDHCHISTSAAVNGGCLVGWGSFVGSQSVLHQGIQLGSRVVVAMGQSVIKDLPDGAQFMGRGPLC